MSSIFRRLPERSTADCCLGRPYSSVAVAMIIWREVVQNRRMTTCCRRLLPIYLLMAIDRPPILPKKKNENRSFYDDLFRNACFGTDACDVIDQSSESSRVGTRRTFRVSCCCLFGSSFSSSRRRRIFRAIHRQSI